MIIIGLGIAAPYIAANYDWRYLYYATSGLGIIAWIMLGVLLPETRWTRSKEMLGKMNNLLRTLCVKDHAENLLLQLGNLRRNLLQARPVPGLTTPDTVAGRYGPTSVCSM